MHTDCSSKTKGDTKETDQKNNNNHTHQIVFTWFGNLPTSTKLQRFHYYQREIQNTAVQFFSLKKKIKKNPNHQNNGFYILRTEFTVAYRPKLLLHELSLKKSLIKKPRNIISSRIIT